MILATSPQPDTTDPIATLPPDLRDFARQAAHNGTTLDTFERGLLKRLLAMGQTTIDQPARQPRLVSAPRIHATVLRREGLRRRGETVRGDLRPEAFGRRTRRHQPRHGHTSGDVSRRASAFDKKERPGNRRLATLGCLYSVDRFVRTAEQIAAALFRDTPVEQPKEVRPEPVFKQYRSHFAFQEPGEEPIGGAMLTWSWLASATAKRHQSGQPIVRLMDGSPTLWDSADACLAEFVDERREAKKPVTVVDILDILHVSSSVWKAAKVFHTHQEQQEAFAQNRLLAILRGEVKNVIAGLRRRATVSAVNEADAKVIATVCGYLENNASRMRYDVYLSAGDPIATGVIEGACRHVIEDRMEQGGMRWTREGAQAMLNLRAINASDAAEEFGFWRQEEGAQRVHPHRQLVVGYAGFEA